MRLSGFKNEALGFQSFEGYTKGEIWNGWDCPYFTFEQAQKVLKAYNELRQIIGAISLAYYDSETDAFVFPDSEDEPETYKALNEQGQNYYPIGAFVWIWEEVNYNPRKKQLVSNLVTN
jgi:hypothetical protein